MNDLPLVTVIIPTYNRPDYLLEAVNSVNNQSYENIELIIVDDASEDPASQVVPERHTELTIRIIRHEDNQGASSARNTGFKFASGEFIAFLDDDDSWDSTKIEKQVEAFQSGSPSVGLIYTGRKFTDGSEITNELTPKKEGNVTKDILLRNFVGSYSAIMIRSEVVEDVGMLDERFPNEQDWEWYIRVSINWEFMAIPEALVTRQHSSNQISSDYELKRNKSYPLLCQKYSPIAKSYGWMFLRHWRSKLYFNLGWEALVRTKEYPIARSYFVKSILTFPFTLDSYVFLIASFVYPLYNFIPPSTKRSIGQTLRR